MGLSGPGLTRRRLLAVAAVAALPAALVLPAAPAVAARPSCGADSAQVTAMRGTLDEVTVFGPGKSRVVLLRRHGRARTGHIADADHPPTFYYAPPSRGQRVGVAVTYTGGRCTTWATLFRRPR